MQQTVNPAATRTGQKNLAGAGLGLRRALLGAFLDAQPEQVEFVEVAPENWIDVGGRYAKQFRQVTERLPLICHGLSLSLGGPSPLDTEFLKAAQSIP